MMARASWDALPPAMDLIVAQFPDHKRQREPYERRSFHRVDVDWATPEDLLFGHLPGLLIGGTPAAENEGLHYPMQFLAPRLEAHRVVHALGVGVDALRTADAIALFRRSYSRVRSWTVRSDLCREALLELGVEPDRIRVGADWAWLYDAARRTHWAAEYWRSLGVDPSEPLLVANVVSMCWNDDRNRRAIAEALELAHRRLGMQLAFFCNETREGDYFDAAAARSVQAFLNAPAVLVPNQCYLPEEVLGLLSHAAVTVSQRYHFSLMSVVAATVPVNIVRGQKMRGLTRELGLEPAGTIESVDRDELVAGIAAALRDRHALLTRLARAACDLRDRARRNNLWFSPEFHGF